MVVNVQRPSPELYCPLLIADEANLLVSVIDNPTGL